MCLAVPMKVVEVKAGSGDAFEPPVAVVDAGGVRQEARLDIVDRPPAIGDYVVVHAGFALHTLDEVEAEASLALLREMSGIS